MPMTAAAPSLYPQHKDAVDLAHKAQLPWRQKDATRPIYDACGKVVSFTIQAPRIVAAMNLINEIATFNADGQACDGEISYDQATEILTKWIEAAKGIKGEAQ